jgi:hydroxymethylpyrimidine/phosphomethylpyrimidine kinase
MIGISIAGFDPSGGAGIIADLKTFTSLGIHGTGVVTALTAQNPSKVFSLQPIATEYIEEQIDSIFDEYGEYIVYGKTGMLYSPKIVKTVAKKIKEYGLKIVVDPVMVASTGDGLSKNEIAKSLKKYLLPHSLLVTPNIHEAELLSGIQITTPDNAIAAAKKIGKICDVVITGGHLEGINTIAIDKEIDILKRDLKKTKNTHGSGCIFSAAITGFMIKDNDIKTSLNKSFDYVEIAIENGHYGTLNTCSEIF